MGILEENNLKKITIKKPIVKIIIVILVVISVLAISSCGAMLYLNGYDYDMLVAPLYYDCDWVIGKTIDEVVEKYGMFDDYETYLHAYYDSEKKEYVLTDTTYQTGCYYINDTRFCHSGLDRRNYGCIFTITFDENGTAVESNYSQDPVMRRKYLN